MEPCTSFVNWNRFNFANCLGEISCTSLQPQAAGSGIPNIKCYLNGIRLPGLLSLKTLLAKAGGVVLSVTGGLACGKVGIFLFYTQNDSDDECS